MIRQALAVVAGVERTAFPRGLKFRTSNIRAAARRDRGMRAMQLNSGVLPRRMVPACWCSITLLGSVVGTDGDRHPDEAVLAVLRYGFETRTATQPGHEKAARRSASCAAPGGADASHGGMGLAH